MHVVNFEASGAGAVLDLASVGFSGVGNFQPPSCCGFRFRGARIFSQLHCQHSSSARLKTELVPVSGDFISPVVEIFRFPMAFL
jgi:hypothetical protein